MDKETIVDDICEIIDDNFSEIMGYSEHSVRFDELLEDIKYAIINSKQEIKDYLIK